MGYQNGSFDITFLENNDNWVTISYGEALDKKTITHSGETIGQVLKNNESLNFQDKALLQEYLEPYSILCHDVLLSKNEPEKDPLINITAHYPVGSKQPAWVDLFREGRFQLFYNSNLIRIFLKGDDPKSSFEEYKSIVKYSIQEVLNSQQNAIENIEIYVFNNNYKNQQIRFNTIPYVLPIDKIELSINKKPIDLKNIANLLNNGVALEAIEVNDKNELYFYGKVANNQTLADKQISLSNIAVIYRSIFHYGYNSPYISLDEHEDNRYAKVNFGGYFDNTRIGHVVLEADKLFKTLSTGLDPNTGELIVDKFKNNINNFMTQDERSFLVNETGNRKIRYWFYPDEIVTVTDGNIGVVQNYQFLADAERMDEEVILDKPIRDTIDHLNQNYNEYEKAINIYKELKTVARIMALVNWLKEMEVGKDVDLNQFLAVEIPEFKTPAKTKKVLATTILTYPSSVRLSKDNIDKFTNVYYQSDLLDDYSNSVTDREFLEIAQNELNDDKIYASYLPYKDLKEKIKEYDPIINANKERLDQLNNKIQKKKVSLNQYNESEVNAYNELIEEYNVLIEKQKELINQYNNYIDKINNMNIKARVISHVGGGISLRPEQFKSSIQDSNSKYITEIQNVKKSLKSENNVSIAGDWIRNNYLENNEIENIVPNINWKLNTKVNSNKKIYSYLSDKGYKKAIEYSNDFKTIIYNVEMKDYNSTVKINKELNNIYVKRNIFEKVINGYISSDETHYVFKN